jgi:hypothetical protein
VVARIDLRARYEVLDLDGARVGDAGPRLRSYHLRRFEARLLREFRWLAPRCFLTRFCRRFGGDHGAGGLGTRFLARPLKFFVFHNDELVLGDLVSARLVVRLYGLAGY